MKIIGKKWKILKKAFVFFYGKMLNIIFPAESEPGVESPSLSPGRYRQPVYDRLDILPNNVPDSDVSMYNTCKLCTQCNNLCTICAIHVQYTCNIHVQYMQYMSTIYNTCTLCTTNEYYRLYIPNYTYSQYTQTVNIN